MTAPDSLRAGDHATWSESLPDYLPSDGWALHYRILSPSGAPVDIAAVAAGDDWSVTLTAAQTAAYTPGRATLVSWVARTDERVTLGQKSLEILPDLAVTAEFDGRTANERGLAEARAALARYVESGRGHLEEYEVAGRRLKFRSLQEIQDLILHYEKQVAADNALRAMADGHAPGRVQVRF